MKFKLKYMSFVLAIFIIVMATPALAQYTLGGDIGIDLENFRINESLKDTVRTFSSNRSLSDHYLSLRSSGPIVNNNLGIYTVASRLKGSFYNVSSTNEKFDEYYTPKLSSYEASLSLLPQKPFPLKLYISRSEDRSLRYEQANRSKLDVLQPGLAAIRRYEAEMGVKGIDWSYTPADVFKFTLEMSKSDMTTSRNYDFDENKDIWVAFTTVPSSIISPVDTVTILNSIEDDSLWIVITSAQSDSFPVIIVDTLDIGESGEYEVNPGYHQFEFYPFNYNSYQTLLKITDNLNCEVLFNDPAAPNDQVQETENGTVRLSYIPNDRVKNETNFNRTVMTEAIRNLDSELSNLMNTLSVDLSSNTKAEIQTTMTSSESIIDTLSSQKSSMFTNKMGVMWRGNSGVSSTLDYTFTKMKTENDDTELESKTNLIMNNLLIPTDWHGYKFAAKNNITTLTDNFGYSNQQYSTELINSLDYTYKVVEFSPKNSTKLSYSKQKNPTSTSKEIDNRFSLVSAIPKVWGLGKFRLLSEYSWKKLIKESGSDIRMKLKLDASTIRKIDKKYKIGLFTTYQRESYGGDIPVAGTNPDQNSPAKEPQSSFLYKIDLGAVPVEEFQLDFSYTIIKQESIEINKIMASLSIEIPKIKLPLKVSFINQGREITGNPKQTELRIDTKTTYQFRRISLILSHSYVKEDLRTDSYDFHEIMGKISRGFNIL